MAITVTVGTAQAFDSSTATETFAFDTGSAPKLLLLCFDQQDKDGDPANVTYDGVALTKVIDIQNTTSGEQYAAIWKLTNPTDGSNTVSIDYNTNAFSRVIAFAIAGSGDIDVLGSATDAGNQDPKVTIDSVAETAVGFVASSAFAAGSTIITGTTEDYYTDGQGFGHETASGTGSRTIGWDTTAQHNATAAVWVGDISAAGDDTPDGEIISRGSSTYQSTRFEENHPWSISLWVKMNSGSGETKSALLTKQASADPFVGLWWHHTGDVGGARLSLGRGGTPGTFHDSTYLPTYREWHLVVAAYDGEFSRLYIDGSLDGSLDFSGEAGVTSNPADWHIGGVADTAGTDQGIDGWVDEATLYPDALTLEEVSDLWRAGIDQYPTSNKYRALAMSFGPINHWEMRDQSGTGTDYAGGNALTYEGAVTLGKSASPMKATGHKAARFYERADPS